MDVLNHKVFIIELQVS